MADKRLREAVGMVVRHLRFKVDLSQTELAAKAGVPDLGWHVSKLETAKWADEMMWATVERLAPALGTTPEAITRAARELAGTAAWPRTPDKLEALLDRLLDQHPPAAEPPAPVSGEAGPKSEAPVVALPTRKPARRLRPQGSTLDLCIDLTETHLLSRLEDEGEDFDAFEVHALANALERLEKVKKRREERVEGDD